MPSKRGSASLGPRIIYNSSVKKSAILTKKKVQRRYCLCNICTVGVGMGSILLHTTLCGLLSSRSGGLCAHQQLSGINVNTPNICVCMWTVLFIVLNYLRCENMVPYSQSPLRPREPMTKTQGWALIWVI